MASQRRSDVLPYDAVVSSPARILGVFAHPDDEAFCAAGTLARYVEAGAEAMVVSATRGQAGQIRDVHAATRRSLGAVREQELRAACKILGVQQAVCLDYGDGTLADVDRAELQDAVLEQFRGFEPDVVITFGDDGAYGHPDHVAISRATSDAVHPSTDRTGAASAPALSQPLSEEPAAPRRPALVVAHRAERPVHCRAPSRSCPKPTTAR